MIAADRLLPADLTGAVLRGADLSGADLQPRGSGRRGPEPGHAARRPDPQADLTDANLTGVRGLVVDQAA